MKKINVPAVSWTYIVNKIGPSKLHRRTPASIFLMSKSSDSIYRIIDQQTKHQHLLEKKNVIEYAFDCLSRLKTWLIFN